MKDSEIEWTHHTLNLWWGCQKVSPACKYCYAESLAKRVGHNVWGKDAERRFLSDNNWKQPLKWDAAASAAGRRERVFCASMSDVFEDRRDLDESRERLWELITATPNLDWLLLTKRPELILDFAPWTGKWPYNVWIGTTVENQKYAEKRLPYLVEIPAAVRFISAEPLLGPLDISKWGANLDWVITGGESGRKPRISDPFWFRDLRDQCEDFGIPFHFKQWGNWAPDALFPDIRGRRERSPNGIVMACIGKGKAGRELDGGVWDELPKPRIP